MAIKVVDVDLGEEPVRKKANAPAISREPDAEALAQPIKPELPHPKPEPKPWGRR